MDVYEFAMKMEKDGESYYRELAAKTGNKGLKNIFAMLADAEVVHYGIFRKMKDNEKVKVATAEILSQVKNVFEKMMEEKDTEVNVSQIESYKKAQEIEKASQDFYLKQGNEVQERDQKDIFLRIAEEEKKHYFILERIIDFVSRPQTWLENPEWYHLEEY
jgi:rubrerythrin